MIKPCERKCYQDFKIKSNVWEKSHWERTPSEQYFDRNQSQLSERNNIFWVRDSSWIFCTTELYPLSYCPALLISYSPSSGKQRRCISEITPLK